MIAVPTEVVMAEVQNQPKEIILRLHGSNTIGAKLASDIAEAFMKILGASTVDRVEIEPFTEMNIEGQFPDQNLIQVIEIKAHGSSTGFDSLKKEQCDIAMSSRKIKEDETSALSFLGDMTDVTCEHVLALDGIAIIIHPENTTISKINIDGIADIFSGKVKNWSQIGGNVAPINLYARDDNSGTHYTFQNIVLGKNNLHPSAKRWDSNEDLSNAVSKDVNAIGYCGLSYVNNNKVLRVSDNGSSFFPTEFTIGTEDYPITRRLYLYTPTNPNNSYVRDFVAYALGDGQTFITENRLMPLSIFAAEYEVEIVGIRQNPEVVDYYLEAVKGAKRLSTNFRFKTDRYDLDTRAVRDLDRMMEFLTKNNVNEIILSGFADNIGSYQHNYELSCNRAKTIEEELKKRDMLKKGGISKNKVICVSEEVPVASNSTKVGRAKNRRVEVWIRE
jgi:phosphate transport system substrate-binding protein